MKITNVKVYGLSESIIRSGYPMKTEIDYPMGYFGEKDFQRSIKLGTTNAGEGHDKALRGIVVQFNITAPRYFYQEWDTYHFAESISSQSTMHRLSKMDIDSQCNKYVWEETKEIVHFLAEAYRNNPTENNLLALKSNLPEGFELTRGVSTNYAQLKTMYLQRKNHKLPEWRVDFCEWVLSLPYFKELCLKDDKK